MFKYLSLKFKVIVLPGGLILSFLALVAFILIGEKNIEEQSTSQIHSLIQAKRSRLLLSLKPLRISVLKMINLVISLHIKNMCL